MSWSKEWPKLHTGKAIDEQQANQGAIEWPSQLPTNEKLSASLKDPEKMYCDPNKTEPKIEFTNGSTITFSGVPDPIKSLENGQDTILTGIDLGAGDSQTILTTYENGEIKHRVLTNDEFYKTEAYYNLKEKVYNNKVPTHDPYTNPNAQIYYQCKCGAILDPDTKSFAALNNCASEKGWKVRWGAHSYEPFCVDCGKDVE